MSNAVTGAQLRVRVLMHPDFNLQMVYAGLGLLLITFIGCPLTLVGVTDLGATFTPDRTSRTLCFARRKHRRTTRARRAQTIQNMVW